MPMVLKDIINIEPAELVAIGVALEGAAAIGWMMKERIAQRMADATVSYLKDRQTVRDERKKLMIEAYKEILETSADAGLDLAKESADVMKTGFETAAIAVGGFTDVGIVDINTAPMLRAQQDLLEE